METTDQMTADGLETQDESDAISQGGAEIAYLEMARAWIDRWKALGGNFELDLGKGDDGVRVLRGMTLALEYWQRPDQDRDDIPPHVRITADEDHNGAVRALDGLLELCPNLRQAVREIAAQEAWRRYARQAGQTA